MSTRPLSPAEKAQAFWAAIHTSAAAELSTNPDPAMRALHRQGSAALLLLASFESHAEYVAACDAAGMIPFSPEAYADMVATAHARRRLEERTH